MSGIEIGSAVVVGSGKAGVVRFVGETQVVLAVHVWAIC